MAAAYCVHRSVNMSSTARGSARRTPRTTPPTCSRGRRASRSTRPEGSAAPSLMQRSVGRVPVRRPPTASEKCAPVAERNALARVVDSPVFATIVVATIAVNAAVLGLQTYEGLEDRWGDALFVVNGICLGIFLVELALRMASYWPRPLAFFR